ncbi:MAG TPA: type II secretion system protein M [Chromatiales bacterium]|nr:type II secretion system protein M [Thiotrichales bacterium]HIP67035.1 type II secretion system protein M [Chromatiales bacterium]
MKAWFIALQPRERLIVTIAAIVLALMLLYLLAWNPISTRLHAARQDVAADRSLLVWMQKSNAEIKKLRGGTKRKAPNLNISLINAVESTARQAGIRKSITHLEPKGDTGISVQIKGANFDQLIRWQATMEKQYAALATQINIKPTDKPGLVDARIKFTRAGA